jgi:hypothetical protein
MIRTILSGILSGVQVAGHEVAFQVRQDNNIYLCYSTEPEVLQAFDYLDNGNTVAVEGKKDGKQIEVFSIALVGG